MMTTPHNLTKLQGFTLVEMTIVMVVIGLLLTTSLRPLSSIVQQRRFELTHHILLDINVNLTGFILLNGRLPCPAKYYEFDGIHDTLVGREDTTLCGQEGYLPWVDLAVGRYDGWGNPFRYRADSQFTGTITWEMLPSEIQVHTTGEQYEQFVPAIIWSDGQNGISDLWENGTFSPAYTDDQYIFVNLFILKKRFVQAKQLP